MLSKSTEENQRLDEKAAQALLYRSPFVSAKDPGCRGLAGIPAGLSWPPEMGPGYGIFAFDSVAVTKPVIAAPSRHRLLSFSSSDRSRTGKIHLRRVLHRDEAPPRHAGAVRTASVCTISAQLTAGAEGTDVWQSRPPASCRAGGCPARQADRALHPIREDRKVL